MNFKNVLPIALSILGIGGVIATAILVAKETPKFNKDLEELKKDDKTRKIDIVKTAAEDYAPALIVGVATIASVASSTILSKKNEISLSSAAIIADTGWRKYKDKIKKVLGIETHKDILDKLSLDDFAKVKEKDRDDLYWEEHVGFFKADPEKLAYAYSDINRRLHDEEFTTGSYPGVAQLCKFFTEAGVDFLVPSINAEDIRFGWDIDYLYENYGYIWVNMNIEESTDDQGNKYKKIIFIEDPIYLDEYESYYKGE